MLFLDGDVRMVGPKCFIYINAIHEDRLQDEWLTGRDVSLSISLGSTLGNWSNWSFIWSLATRQASWEWCAPVGNVHFCYRSLGQFLYSTALSFIGWAGKLCWLSSRIGLVVWSLSSGRAYHSYGLLPCRRRWGLQDLPKQFQASLRAVPTILDTIHFPFSLRFTFQTHGHWQALLLEAYWDLLQVAHWSVAMAGDRHFCCLELLRFGEGNSGNSSG